MDEILHDDNHDMNDDISGIQVDDRLKKTMFDLEQHWLAEYMDARERLLSTLTEKVCLYLSTKIATYTSSVIDAC